MFGWNFLIALYLSRFSPRRTRSAQRVSSRFFCRVFSLLSGGVLLICLTVLSRARIAIRYEFVCFDTRALACLNKFSCPACK